MRRKSITPTIRRIFEEMADAAAWSKRQVESGKDVDFDRIRYVVLQNSIAHCMYVTMGWTRDDARHYATALVESKIKHQNATVPQTITTQTTEK